MRRIPTESIYLNVDMASPAHNSRGEKKMILISNNNDPQYEQRSGVGYKKHKLHKSAIIDFEVRMTHFFDYKHKMHTVFAT